MNDFPAIRLLNFVLQRAWLVCLAALLPAAGCQQQDPPEPPPNPAEARAVRVLVVDDAPLAEALGRTWRSRSEAPIEVSEGTQADLTAAGLAEIDLIVYPPRLLGELVEAELLEPLSAEVLAGEQVEPEDIFSLLRRREITWGQETYALPFGSPPLVLMYRPDLLEERGLAPPTTWTEYQALLPKLAEAPQGAAEWSAACEPLAAEWLAENLLARAAAYAQHKSHYSTLFDMNDMRPLINTPPYERALTELAAAAPHSPAVQGDLTPAECRLLLARGECALAWSWLTQADAELATAIQEGQPKLAFAPLPGSAATYNFSDNAWETRAEDAAQRVTLLAVSGQVGSVCRHSPRRKSAAAALAWLTSTEWSAAIAPASQSTTLFRGSQVPTAGAWCPTGMPANEVSGYADAVVESLTAQNAERGLTLPGGAEYEAALTAAIEKVLAGEASPSEALEQAATAWETITERLGRDEQTAAYRRSLGLE